MEDDSPEAPGDPATPRLDGGALLRALSDVVPDAIWMKDLAGRTRFVNAVALRVFGMAEPEVVGRTAAALGMDDGVTRQVMESDRAVLERGETVDTEATLPDADGALRVWQTLKTPYRNRAGRIVGLVGLARDITDRKRMEEALRRSESRYRTFSESVGPLAFAEPLRDGGGEIIDWIFRDANSAFLETFKLRREQVVGGRASDLFGAERLRTLLPGFRSVFETGEPLRYDTSRGERQYAVAVFRLDERSVGTKLTDITEQRQAEEVLRESDRRKSEFLALLSHELRNPLAPIGNALEVLDRAAAGSAEAERAKGVIRRQTAHLTRLVNDLLDINRISHDRLELHRERVELVELVRRTSDDYRSVFEERGITLYGHFDVEPMWVDVDPTRISQVLGNLLHNAAKFTPRGGTTMLRVSSDVSRARVAVSDDGRGFDPALAERLFDRFTQGDGGLARSQGGLGLGLTLVRSLMELHGGSVTAHSGGTGQGAEFRLELPRAAPPLHPASRARVARATTARTVLIIEDNIDAGQTLADVIELFGHRAYVANDGATGMAKARELRPDFVLCDLGLPDMSGFEVATALRADEALANTCLIAVTGYAQPEDLRRAREAGFDLHLAKPPPLAKLEELLGAPR